MALGISSASIFRWRQHLVNVFRFAVRSCVSTPAILLVCVLTLGGLSGCAVGPDFKVPEAPDVALTPRPVKASLVADRVRQHFAKGLDIPGEWWTLFRSRNLASLMQTALQHNYDLKTAQATLRVAVANAEAQRGVFYPTVLANYAPTRQKTATADLAAPTNSGSPFYALHTAQLSISYVPDVFGGNRRQVESLETWPAVSCRRRNTSNSFWMPMILRVASI